MTYPAIAHHGATAGVTGSCHQIWLDDTTSLLIDCGQFQGEDAGTNDDTLGFPIDGIRALILTHVHIDHVGRIPQLLAAGFDGPILCSEPSARLLPIVLEDAFRLSISKNAEDIERYLAILQRRIIAMPYDAWFTLLDNAQTCCRIRLQPAGHVMGSAYVELELDQKEQANPVRVVFSGDLGAPFAPIMPDVQAPERADLLILESTYGDRLHEDRQHRRARLEAAIDKALRDQGTVMIPAFSIGRTQELLYELEEILHAKSLDNKPHPTGKGIAVDWPELPVILDSPLASRFTRVYQELEDYWDSEAQALIDTGRQPLAFKQLITIDSHTDHIAVVNHLTQTARPAIVIAASGMCAGGRIVNYLKAMLGDPRHNVLFVGYQAKGTPGHAIETYGPEGGYVELDGQRFTIRADVQSLGGYSAHADQKGLLDFVTGMQQWPGEIRLVHGEGQAKARLSQAIEARYRQAGKQVAVVIP